MSIPIPAAAKTDAYKLHHIEAYLPNTNFVYGNKTSRSAKLSNIPKGLLDGTINFGWQRYILRVLKQQWDDTFFKVSKKRATRRLKKHFDAITDEDYNIAHFEALHDLGYLPLHIKALPEGVLVPYGVAPATFINTKEGFGWLVNYLETVCSNNIWPMMTSTTTSTAFLKQTIQAYKRTGVPLEGAKFMNHDFSMRGMFGDEAAAMSGLAHLASGSVGSDTVPASFEAEDYYFADVEKECVMKSVFATEHSTATSAILAMVQKLGITKRAAEILYVRYLFKKRPNGIVSHVSDSFDFWDFVVNSLKELYDDIMSRDGMFVVRPDTGNPVKVITGYKVADLDYTITKDNADSVAKVCAHQGFEAVREPSGKVQAIAYHEEFGNVLTGVYMCEAETKGLYETLYEMFPGGETSKGFRMLDCHIGAIYGDSITLQKQAEINKRLEEKNFAPILVLGAGSYSYQYVTRDTHGSAVKATWCEVEGVSVDVEKAPKTDLGKKSAKGLLRIELENGVYVQYDQQTKEQEKLGCLRTIFIDGQTPNLTTLEEVRAKVANYL